ncbi:Hypothetical predicted protein [Marmota monax]|uniref:Retinoic acid receptor RXR n=1 Tax=Marmota monax TaxID=9995 RepID=A0A5E4CJN0_MARMO|nr:Hypothetical predicted protein [Marmota monax]
MYGNYPHFMKFPAGFGGSPGHAGSTSMSPSAALSTGKPMDSHPSFTDTPVSAPRTLSATGTPLTALGSPYRVITTAMGPPSGALAAPPGVRLVAPPSSQGWGSGTTRQRNFAQLTQLPSQKASVLPRVVDSDHLGQSSCAPGHPSLGLAGEGLVKEACSTCDRSMWSTASSGKHYGVYSCEGCKGFFKRTIRKDLVYTCRDNKDCLIDKRQRNRCQYCRYQKCLVMGMKREAVQEERQRSRERAEGEADCAGGGHEDMPVERILEAELAVEPKTESYGDLSMESSTNDPVTNICHAADKQLFTLVEWAKRVPHFSDLTLEDQVILLRAAVQEERQRSRERAEGEADCAGGGHEDMPVERILEAELAVEPKTESYGDLSMESSTNDPVTNICHAADKQLFTLVEWAKRVPHFSDLTLEDQVILLRAGWNELLIASFSHRSVSVQDGILLATGLHVHRSSAHSAGVGSIFDRVLTELVSKMKDMQMDKSELGCLRAIVLFNPDAKGLSNPSEVETLREKVYATLEAYTKQKYPEQPGRFAKLLLRLPALRSIGLKCLEHLFFFKLIGDTPIDTFLMEMLETPLQIT